MVVDSSGQQTGRSRLRAERAFVVHLSDDSDPAGGKVIGRVEHVTTGQSGRFNDVAGLLAFFRRTLAAQKENEG